MALLSTISRRRLLISSGAALIGSAAHAAAPLLPTPGGAEGPFYPYGELKPADRDWDLADFAGQGPANGGIIYIMGRVLGRDENPVSGATVEIWQANAEGNYNHPDNYRDDKFQGFGAVTTGADGRYRFRTIKPGAYGVAFFQRTPHIHFKVKTGDEFVTQMYFAGEPTNGHDGQYHRVGDAAAQARVTTSLNPAENIERGARAGRFDLILES